MVIDEQQRFKLEDFLERMSSYKARHTELITVYVPGGMDINIITRQLEAEKSTAANIKSTATRKNVEAALESLIRICKQMRQAPKKGVCLFSGNVSQVEGQDNFLVEIFEPPEELNMRLYRCDQTFVLDPLFEMLEVKEVYGLLVIERKEATIGLLIGKKIKVLKHIDSFVPGKVRAGGQCLDKSSLITTKNGIKQIEDVKIGEKIKAFDLKNNKVIFTKVINKWINNKPNIRKFSSQDKDDLIISSLDHTFFTKKNNIFKEAPAGDLYPGDLLILNNNGKIKELEIFDVFDSLNDTDLIDIETEAGNFFANDILVHNSSQRYHRITEGLAKDFYRKIADLVKSEFFSLKGLKGILVGGPGPTKEDFLKEGNLVTALLDKVIAVKDIGYADEHGLELLVETSQDILAGQEIIHEQKILEKFFNMLGKERDKTVYGNEEVEKALSYGAVDVLLLSKKLNKDIIRKYERLAQETSVKTELISTELDEGVQFWNLSGIGAILRFKIA